jgi:hypothetical protein
MASEREIALMRNPTARPKFQWSTLKRLPLVMSVGIGLCINQTRAVLEALAGRETEFVRTPKHGIRGKLESWSSNKYRAAKSITPFIELAMAAYFVIAIGVAIDHRHFISIPFLCLFLCGFGYVGWGSLFGSRRRATKVVAPVAYPVLTAAVRPGDELSGEIVVANAPSLPTALEA